MVHDAARRADDDVHALAQRDGLRHHVDAADQRHAAHVDAGAQRLELLRDLRCGLQRGCRTARAASTALPGYRSSCVLAISETAGIAGT